MRRAWPVCALVALAGCASASGEMRIVAERSAFEPGALSIQAGSSITFVVENRDPIAHEFIVGTAAEHRAHEQGHDASHDGAPGAASLAPGETERVVVAFDEPGEYEYACHLPGHYAYGMRGSITVT